MTGSDLGPGWLVPYYQSEFRLRFELGGETFWQVTHVVPRFIQALERSRSLANAVFRDDQTMAVVGSWNLPKKAFSRMYPRDSTGPLLLENMGFRDVEALARWKEKPPWCDPNDPEDGLEFDWAAYDLTVQLEMRDTLIWTSNAYEIGIHPKAPVVTYLFGPNSGVVFHVYDDRGLDVMSLTPEPLMPIYKQFNSWVLDYDRPRIEDVFGLAG